MIHVILQQLVTIFAVSATVVVVFHFMRQPAIAGFIIAGIMLGPFGFGWIEDPGNIHLLADIGLIFLLFSIGIEFSVKSLTSMWRAFFGVGALQVFFTSLIACSVVLALGLSLSQSILIGFLVSLSSTAIALNILHKGRVLTSPYGALSVAVLLFQDLFAVPLLLVLPLFSSNTAADSSLLLTFLVSLLRALVLIVSVFIGSRYLVPLLLRLVSLTGVRELFLMAVAVLIFGSAWLGAQIGLSVVFGAFLAGMLVSETQYGHQIIADLVPLREPFVALFFISVGMLLDINHFLANFAPVLGLAAGVLVVKALVGTLSALALRYDLRVATLMGVLLSQVGEFTFVIASAARQMNALGESEYQTLLSVSVVTMLVNPSMFLFGPKLIPAFVKNRLQKLFLTQKQTLEKKSDHVVIIGLGLTGQTVARALQENDIPFTCVESDATVFHSLQGKNLPVIFGDGARQEILESAHIKEANLVMVAINDINWAVHIVGTIRHLCPALHVLVRCEHFRDTDKFKNLKVDEFVVAEAQMASECSERVLRYHQVSQEVTPRT